MTAPIGKSKTIRINIGSKFSARVFVVDDICGFIKVRLRKPGVVAVLDVNDQFLVWSNTESHHFGPTIPIDLLAQGLHPFPQFLPLFWSVRLDSLCFQDSTLALGIRSVPFDPLETP